MLYIAGISKNARFLKYLKIVSFKPLYTDKLSFQALCGNDSVSFFYETPASIPYDLFPQEFNSGIICSSKITDFLLSDVIDAINYINRTTEFIVKIIS